MEIFNIHIEISLIIILNALFFSNFIIVLQQLAYSQEDTSSPTANEDSSQIRITSETKQVAFLIIIGVISLIIYKEFRKRYGKHRERQHFPVDVKEDTVQKQHHKCAICKNGTRVWDFDHKDGNRSNNRLSNYQALCPNCHAKKTRGLLKQQKKSSFLRCLTVDI
ncbi:MAG: HNH endonuclease signature motif containing protein [Nitrososphaeraceae archaeon]